MESKAGKGGKTIKIGNFSSCRAKNVRFDTSFLATTPAAQAIALMRKTSARQAGPSCKSKTQTALNQIIQPMFRNVWTEQIFQVDIVRDASIPF